MLAQFAAFRSTQTQEYAKTLRLKLRELISFLAGATRSQFSQQRRSLQSSFNMIGMLWLAQDFLVNATIYRELAPKLDRGANEWVFHSFVNSRGYIVESSLEPHFNMLKVDPPVQRSTSLANLVSPSASSGKQRIVRDYANRFPPGFESFVTVASHCLLSNSYEPPSHEALTQHIELVFVRGFMNSGGQLCKHLLNTLLSVHMLNVSANLHTISNSLRTFIAPPFAGSTDINTLHTKKWFLLFVRSFLLAEITTEDADAYLWAGEESTETMNPVIPGASYVLVRRDGRSMFSSLYSTTSLHLRSYIRITGPIRSPLLSIL